MDAVLDSRHTPLDPALRSLVTVRVAQIDRCRFCVDLDSATLARCAGSMDKVEALAGWRESSLFAEKARVALEDDDEAAAVTVAHLWLSAVRLDPGQR